MGNVLVVKDLNLFYDYGKKKALFDISFNIPENNVTAIIGPSGCGKSSFLRCINRMNDLIEGAKITGAILFEGVNIYGKSVKPTPAEIAELKRLKNEILKHRIPKNKFAKIAATKYKNSPDIKNHIAKALKTLKEETIEEKSAIEVQHQKRMNELKDKLEKIKNADKKAYYMALISVYSHIIKAPPKPLQSSNYLLMLKIIKQIKNEKNNYKNTLKQIKYHYMRKTMEIHNYKQECIDNEINKLIKDHFDNVSVEYEDLYKKYENQYRIVKGWTPDEVRSKIGLVFQKPNPFAKSVFENVAFGLRAHGITDPWIIYTAVEKALKDAALWSEVKDRLNESALSLSGGQQQRLCIARAIALKPKILLMDEPTASLDPIATKNIEELIRELRKKFTIIIVTHSMQQAARVSDKTAFFYQGRLIEFSSTHDIFKNPKFKKTKQYITGDFG